MTAGQQMLLGGAAVSPLTPNMLPWSVSLAEDGERPIGFGLTFYNDGSILDGGQVSVDVHGSNRWLKAGEPSTGIEILATITSGSSSFLNGPFGVWTAFVVNGAAHYNMNANDFSGPTGDVFFSVQFRKNGVPIGAPIPGWRLRA